MSHDSDLLDLARALEVAVVERVVTMLEKRWPIGEIGVPLHNHIDLQERLRKLRARLHGCAEREWTGRYDAPQTETPTTTADEPLD